MTYIDEANEIAQTVIERVGGHDREVDMIAAIISNLAQYLADTID